MSKEQHIVNALIEQRNQALNAVAELQGHCAALQEIIAEQKQRIEELESQLAPAPV